MRLIKMWNKKTTKLNFKTYVNILPRPMNMNYSNRGLQTVLDKLIFQTTGKTSNTHEIVVFLFLRFMSLNVHKYIITSRAASIPPTPPNTIRRCLNSGSVQSSTSVPYKKELLS